MLLTRTLKVEKQGLRKNQGPTNRDFEELQITRTQKLEKQGFKKKKLRTNKERLLKASMIVRAKPGEYLTVFYRDSKGGKSRIFLQQKFKDQQRRILKNFKDYQSKTRKGV